MKYENMTQVPPGYWHRGHPDYLPDAEVSFGIPKPPEAQDTRRKPRRCISDEEMSAMAQRAKVVGKKSGIVVSCDPQTNVHLIESTKGETLAYVLPNGDFRDFTRPLTTREKQVVRDIIEEKTGKRSKKRFPWLLLAGGTALYFAAQG